MRVSNFLIKDFCQGDEATVVADIISCWNKKSRPNVFIVENTDGTMLGVVTVSDILKRVVPFFLQIDENLAEFASDQLLSKSEVKEILQLAVADLMSVDVITVAPNDSFLEAAAKMMEGNFDYLPVVDSENKCVGVVTRDKLDDALVEFIGKKSDS